ncbi:TIR domain-containing protein [Sphingobium aquiterrae]|uniref:TIR domain-containing protein n=1 Tax=Sphingobium aquiterrae TaxID=2038656 RepID=UPI0030166B14
MAADEQALAATYAAFLSYNHKDAGEARRLHRRLEAYRLPRGLTHGDPSRKLGPIFRDQDELPAAADLSEAVKAAIAKSQALVVLCSPHAAASSWVDQEIRLFRAIHPDRPVLAALVAGEPEDAFPAALREGYEPLAADLRPDGGSYRHGMLKLVAGLAGVGLDQLVQRDAQRRIRRVTAITVVSLIVMLCLLMLSVFAWQARREAEKQRAEAEGLVEFMLTDLRQRLRSVGRLDALAAANEQAMNYYRAQGDLERLPSASLERRARILHAMGEDDIAKGNLAGALGKFNEAHRTTAAMLENAPHDPERIFVHAQSEFWVGYVDQLEKRPDEALSHYSAYLDQAQQLLKQEPNRPRSFVELGYALSNIGAVKRKFLADYAGALADYERSLAWFQRAQAADPKALDVRMEVAERHARISDVQFDLKHYPAARAHRLEQLRLLAPLRQEDPQNGDLAYDTLVATRALARIAFEIRDFTTAAGLLKDAEVEAARLQSRDRDNQRWFEQYLRVVVDAAEVAAGQKNEAEVVRLSGLARGLLREDASHPAAEPAFQAETMRRLKALDQPD